MRLAVALAALLVAAVAAPASGHAVLGGAPKSLRARDVLQGQLSTDDASEQEERKREAAAPNRVAALMQLVAEEMPGSKCKELGLFILAVACCISPLLQACFMANDMPMGRVMVQLFAGITILFCCIHLYQEGMVSKVVNGEPMGGWCLFVSLYAFIVLTCWAIQLCCIVSAGVTVVVAAKAIEHIKNESVKKIRQQFDEMSADLTPELKAYYSSQEFKDKCDTIFVEADKDGNGTLDMNELRETVLSRFTNPDSIITDPFFIMAFDKNGSSEIEQDEFYELMKYFDMVYPLASQGYSDGKGTLASTTTTTAPAPAQEAQMV